MTDENKPITVLGEDNVQIFAKEVFNVVKQNFVTNDSLSTSINELENKINNVGRS